MEEEVLKKIFEYNSRWLLDRSTAINKNVDKYIEKKVKLGKNKSGNYLAGALIRNELAIEVKEALKKEMIESGETKNKDLFGDIMKISKNCILTDIFRYEECTPDQFYRPAVSFITTKRNSLKLKYLEEQEVPFSYICIDYDKVKYSDSKENKEIPLNIRKFRKSKNFDTGKTFEKRFIPLHIGGIEFSLDKEDYKIVKKQIDLEKDFYYKEDIFDFFQTQVNKKIDLEIDLDDWSYCIVFSPKWCSTDYIQENQGSTVSVINSIIEKFKSIVGYEGVERITRRDLNSSSGRKNVDRELLFYIMKCFDSPSIAEKYIYSKIGSLCNFDVLELGFKKFKEGGYWIKKISYKKDKYIEETEGPYDKKDGEKRVKILENIMQLRDSPVAKLYKFGDLVCDNDLLKLEYSTNIDNYVNIEDRWYPSEGALVFCLVHRMSDITYFSREKLTQKFQVFNDYAINSGMKVIGTMNCLIYFNPDIKKSLIKAGQLKKLLNSEGEYLEENFIWLLDAVLEKKTKRGKEPDLKPFPVSGEDEKKGRLSYNQMIDIYETIQNIDCESNRLNFSFDEFKSSFNFGFVESYKNQDDEIKTIISTGIVMNSEDDKPKKFKIIKNYDGTYELAMKRVRKRFDDINLISITEIENCKGHMNINFKNMKDKTWNLSRLNLFSEDIFFNKEVVLIMLTLFMAKCFGVKGVYLDTRPKTTECENKILMQYYNIYYLGIGNFQKFKELGFVVKNEEEYDKVLEDIRNINIKEYAIKNKIKIKVTKEIKDLTVSEFCKNYIEMKKCPPPSYITILSKISEEIEKDIKLEIYNNIDDMTFEFIESYITHDNDLE